MSFIFGHGPTSFRPVYYGAQRGLGEHPNKRVWSTNSVLAGTTCCICVRINAMFAETRTGILERLPFTLLSVTLNAVFNEDNHSTSITADEIWAVVSFCLSIGLFLAGHLLFYSIRQMVFGNQLAATNTGTCDITIRFQLLFARDATAFFMLQYWEANALMAGIRETAFRAEQVLKNP